MTVFPAGAGMIRPKEALGTSMLCVPRRRGDDPTFLEAQGWTTKCSPQARG